MIKYLGFIAVLLVYCLVDCTVNAVGVIDHVNMYIGTSYSHNISDVHDYGNTMLSIGVPNAHTPWTPQTRSTENKCESPYYYFDKQWKGLRRTHWMSGSCVIDYGTATILPSLTLDLNEALNYHALNHTNEVTHPHYYKMFLQESQLEVEVTSQNAAGIFRSRMKPPSAHKYYYLLFMASDTMYNQSSVEISASGDSEGGIDTVVLHSPVHRWYQSKGEYAGFDGHHVFKTSRPALEYGVIHGYSGANMHITGNKNNIEASVTSGRSDASGPAVAYLKFEAGEDVTVTTACSFINAEKAQFNMLSELSTVSNGVGSGTSSGNTALDLQSMADSVGKVWEQQLSVIEVSTNSNTGTTQYEQYTNNSIILYTSLWHSLLLPRVVSDADGAYLKFTDSVRTVEYTQPQSGSGDKCESQLTFGQYYDDYSMWDIFRAQVPLLHLILPTATVRDLVASLVVKAQQGRWMPIFPAWNSYTGEMVGDHCAVWIADAVLKGLVSTQDEVVRGLVRGSDCGAYTSVASSGSADVTIDSDTNTAVDTSATTTPALHGALYYTLKNALLTPVSHYEYANSRGRRALTSHLQYGYIPLEDLILESPHPRQQVSRSVEYAYDDYVLSQLLQYVMQSDSSAHSSVGVDNSVNDVSSIDSEWDTAGWAVDHVKTVDADHTNNLTPTTVNDTATHTTFLQATLNTLREHATYYKHVIDTSVGFVRGRHANGSFTAQFDPSVYYTWITETSVWQYTWFVPHNVEHLVELYGGGVAFVNKLNTFFDKGYYNHGNEPDHHSAYLSAYVQHSGDEDDAVQGGAWQVAPRVSRIIRDQYSAAAKGLPGNEDAGQMSAWLVMSAIGVYQVCPGCGTTGHATAHLFDRGVRGVGGGEYVLGVPLFDDLTLHLPARGDAKDTTSLRILVHNRLNNTQDSYIQQLSINGTPYQCAFITHNMLLEGGVWEFYMGAKPNKAWGAMGRKCVL